MEYLPVTVDKSHLITIGERLYAESIKRESRTTVKKTGFLLEFARQTPGRNDKSE